MAISLLQMPNSSADALHGDIGIVGREDLVVMVSKSGATEELLRLVPYVKASPQPFHRLATSSAGQLGSAVSYARMRGS